MRFIKQHLESIAGVEIYPILSLLIFFIFFVGLAIYIFRVDRSFLNYMKNSPLELSGDDEPNTENN
jgi:cbb3-type cytochrome oxidase subunit 3